MTFRKGEKKGRISEATTLEKRKNDDNGKENSSSQKGSNKGDEEDITVNHEVDKG